MIGGDLNHGIYALMLSLVAGTPLLLASLCCTPMRKIAAQALPLAAISALLASFLVPSYVLVEVPWFFMSGRMGLDDTGRIFLCVSAFIWLLAALSGRNQVDNDPENNRFNGFFLAAMAGNFGLILAQDMLGYYLFFALMSFSAYGLVVHKGTEEAHRAGRSYLVFVMIGEVALFLALVILADSANGLLLEDLIGVTIHPFVLVLLFIGFGIKIGALPFHVWMPTSYQAVPAPAAAALAGAMVNAGLLGWLRFIPLGEVVSPAGSLLFIVAGGLAALYGVIIGLNRKRAGTILAYSSISQMGIMTVIFGLGLTGLDAGDHAAFILILYAVHHSLAKSSLFLGYGVLANRKGPLSKWHIAGLLLPSLSLAGMPLTSGAVSKVGFKELTNFVGEPWLVLSGFFLPITAVGTTLLVLHFIRVVRHCEGSEKTGSTSGPGAWIASLLAVSLAIWLWPAVQIHVDYSIAAAKLWQSLWPIVTGGLLFWAWRRCVRRREIEARPFVRDINTIQGHCSGFDWWKKLHQVIGGIEEELKEHEVERRNNLVPYKSFSWFLRQEMKSIYSFNGVASTVKVLISGLSGSGYAGIDFFLRKTEKIMGRWTVVGLSYVLLCILFFFFLG